MKEKMEGERVASPTGGVVGEGTQQVVCPEGVSLDTIDDVNGNPTDPDTQLQVRTCPRGPPRGPAGCRAGVSHQEVVAPSHWDAGSLLYNK